MFADMIRPCRTTTLAMVLTFVMAVHAGAQQPNESDLQALRFYLQQNNDQAVESELRRLGRAFPEWTPPENLDALAQRKGPDTIDRIYDLIEAEEYDAARNLIEETNRAFSDWTPPADMLELLRLSEAQKSFDTAVAEDRASTAIGIARGIPALLSCERVNNAWQLADMHLALGDTEDSLGIYRSILRTCAASETVIATLEKADEIASVTELAELSDLAQSQAPEATAQIRRVEDRLRAGRQVAARWGGDEKIIDVQEGQPTRRSDSSLRPVARPQTLDTSPKSARRTKEQATAQTATQAPRQGSGNLSAVQAAAERGAWTQCLGLAAGSANIQVIYQSGWCAYNADRPMQAIAAFRQAAARGGTADVRRDANYGLLLTMLQLDMTEQAARRAAAVPLTRTQRIEIEGQILDQRGVRAYNRGDYAQAVAFLEEHERLTGVTRRDLAMLKGYALVNLNRRAAARQVFERLHSQLSTPETRRALSQID